LSYKRKLRKILIAIDGSKESIAASDYALSIVARSGAELILLYVFYSQIAFAYSSYLSKVEDSTSLDSILRSAEGRAKQWFEVVRGKLKDVNGNNRNVKLKTDVIVTSTSVSDAMLDYADHNMVNLIIVGTRDKSAFKKALLGSTTSDLLKYSHCPVLIVKNRLYLNTK
jgi:nucleotide-binding universal stress UspA family protein